MARSCTYVIPYRGEASGVRETNLLAVLRRISATPGLEVIVSEQAAETAALPERLPDGVRHVWTPGLGPFNKARACNAGFRAATTDVLAFGDADLLVAREDLDRAMRACSQGAGAVKPFDRLVDLTAAQSQSVSAGGPLPDVPADVIANRREGREDLPFCGGLFVVRREVFSMLGGFHQGFLGWGGEDDAMSVKVLRLVPEPLIAVGRTAYHLWHDRPPDRYRHAHYRANVERLGEHVDMDRAELEALCAADQAVLTGEPTPLG